MTPALEFATWLGVLVGANAFLLLVLTIAAPGEPHETTDGRSPKPASNGTGRLNNDPREEDR